MFCVSLGRVLFFYLFLGCQGQPGEGPVWLGRYIWRGSEGRGSDQHRGQRGHPQGSVVDLWYDKSAPAPWLLLLVIGLILHSSDAGLITVVNIIGNGNINKTSCSEFVFFPLPLGNHFCFFDGNQKSICFSSSVTSVSRRFHVCFVQWMKLRNKFIWNLHGSGVCGVFFKSGPLPCTWWRLYAIFLMHKDNWDSIDFYFLFFCWKQNSSSVQQPNTVFMRYFSR